MEKFSFPQRIIEAWNSLSEVVMSGRSVYSFKEKLDNCRYGEGATQCPAPVKLQLGKYTHAHTLIHVQMEKVVDTCQKYN